MVNVKRIDLGVDIVALPERNLICLHPDLDYAEALGAIMGALPEIHPDVAQRLVEKVTPRPCGMHRRAVRTLGNARAALVALVIGILFTLYTPGEPALASASFGPDWHAAASSLGLRCFGDSHDVRQCVARDGNTVRMSGYRHDTSTVYVAQGGNDDAIIFVFDDPRDATHYSELHPSAEQHGRAIIWR